MTVIRNDDVAVLCRHTYPTKNRCPISPTPGLDDQVAVVTALIGFQPLAGDADFWHIAIEESRARGDVANEESG